MNAITGKKPVELFDYNNLEKSYRELLKKHHPDVGGNQEDFLHITECYEIAKHEKSAGYAVGSDAIYIFKDKHCIFSDKKIDYSKIYEFSYGKVYDGSEYTVYEFTGSSVYDEILELKKNYGRTRPAPFPFPNAEIRDKFRLQVPYDIDFYQFFNKSERDRMFVVFKKEPGFILLSEIIPYKIPVETSVWMFNRLYALGCYMQMTDIYNLDISPYTVLFSLENHTVQLLGGWWYMTKEGQKMSKMPLATYNLLTNRMKDTKTASIEIVTEQIKNVMRTILKDRDIPKPYRNWLSLPAQENIIDEYYQWEHEVLPKIFPVRKFYKWTI